MRINNAFAVTVASFLMLVGLLLVETTSADDRVVVFGDSWGFLSAPSLRRTFDAQAPGNDIRNAAIPGDKASDLSNPNSSDPNEGLLHITSTLATHSTADLVHLSLGGNDLQSNWTAALSPADEDTLLTRITDDIEAVVLHIVAQRPDIEVFYSSYTYLRPLPDLGTVFEVNTVLENLQSRVEARLANIPRATAGNFYGLMQTLWGTSALPDVNLPGPSQAFFDAIHLTAFGPGPLGYDQLADAQYEAFYQSRLAAVLDGDYNGNGIVDAADYTVWRNGGSPDSSQTGYDLWKANFGNTSGSGSSSGTATTAVPEPSTITLILLAASALLGRTIGTKVSGHR